ncbi:MAG: hypothetical protein K1X74_02640 [Pirellulales bacterium]|nr:hypothetical protein [Pirellulales bacterium]
MKNMAIVAKSIGLVLMALACLGTTQVRAEKLTWKFKKGDKAQYASLNKMEMAIDAGGVEFTLELDQALDTTWEVMAVGSDGTAEITQTIDRLQFKLNSPFTGEFTYDSKNPVPGEGQIWDRLGPVLESLTGQKVMLKITAQGEVKDITLPEKLVESLNAGGGGDGPSRMFGAGFTEETVKEMINDGVLPLPADAVKDGDTWEKVKEMKLGPIGSQKTKTTYKLAGMTDKDGKQVANIEVATEVTMEAAEAEGDTEVEVELTEQEASGNVLFDPATGRTVEATTKQMVTMEGDFQGNEFIQERTITVTLKQGVNADILPAPEKKEEAADDKPEGDKEEKKEDK